MDKGDDVTYGPCAKTTVRCTIQSADGELFIGENWCANPQPKWPREPGEDYTKCTTICRQEGHAERVALRLAGSKEAGGVALLRGHTYMCQSCQEALYGAGVLWLGVRR